MLDINLFREEKGGNPELIRESQRKRFASVELVDEVIAADKQWRDGMFEIDELRKQINAASLAVRNAKKAKDEAAAATAIATSKSTQAALKEKESAVAELKAAVDTKLKLIGNLVHPSVPVSQDESNNIQVRVSGEHRRQPESADEPRLYHHHELLWMIGGYDPARGSAVAGHRGYFLRGPGLRLQQALTMFATDFAEERGFVPLAPPLFMSKDVMAETAQLSAFDEELYKVVDGSAEDKYLIATSEQPISAYHRGEFIDPKDLPFKYAGVSSCFRKEAGKAGKETWGIFRVHQFDKVEQFVLTSPDEDVSWAAHEELIKNASDLNDALGIPYEVVILVSGDLNNATAKKYDLQGWFPARGEYRELVSVSNCLDYQARDLEVRYGYPTTGGSGQKDKRYVHMLNGTLCALSRTISCLLENHQTPKGVVIPECLRRYLPASYAGPDGDWVLPFVNEPPSTDTSTGKKTLVQGKGQSGKGGKGGKGGNADDAPAEAAAEPSKTS